MKSGRNQLINFLKNEHSDCSFDYSKFRKNQAASILEQLMELKAKLHIDWNYGKISPELIQDIDQVLTEQVVGIFGGSLTKAGGTNSVAGILNTIGKKGTENNEFYK